MAEFVDRVVLHVSGGRGGNGCVSVRREKFKPLGGPNGGNGGNGGAVILRVDNQTTTLLEYHHSPHQHAPNGDIGRGDMHHGFNGEDLILTVPQGTVVKDREGNVLADLLRVGDEYVAARGGMGGLGNAALASAKRKAPGFALLGTPGEEADIVLELKSIADVALVGYPSAGKSSLIAAISAARPKIADYPFTTLIPNLGVVQAGDVRYTVADVPGLIEGASEGRGLGHRFLRHVERSSALVHVIDCATLEPGRDPISDFEVIRGELQNYEVDPTAGVTVPLHERPQIVVLNKIDVPPKGFRGKKKQEFTIRREERNLEPLFRVIGEKPERWIQQTDFNNDEAVGYLADRLARLGVEDELFKAGARAGDAVVIGENDNSVIFDWEPTMVGGAELLSSPRGTDARLEEIIRPTRAQKRVEYKERMDAKAEARAELESERAAGVWTESVEYRKKLKEGKVDENIDMPNVED